jgi:hypothetical protein
MVDSEFACLRGRANGDARAAALDLSVADPRFAPAVLEAAARRAVEAWALAVDGDDAALESVASREALGALLYPGDSSRRTRLVVRGPRVRAIRIAGLDAGGTGDHDDRCRAGWRALRGEPRHGRGGGR